MAEQSDNAPAKSHAVPESETELSTFAVEAIEPSFGLELVDTSVKPTDNSNISGPTTEIPANNSLQIESDEVDKKIRRSTRDIKRPKFDDELVDSGLCFSKKRSSSERVCGESTSIQLSDQSTDWNPTGNMSNTDQGPSSSSIINQEEVTEQSSVKLALRKRNHISIDERQMREDRLLEEELERAEKKRREARIASKDIRAKELAAANEAAEALAADDLNAWTVADDIALITAVTHICDLRAVHANVVFSQEYSLDEIDERWYQLMYDDTLSRQAKKRMSELPIQDILRIQSNTVFSLREEELLRTIPLKPDPTMAIMEKLLKTHPEDFHSARTPQVLLDQWHVMKMAGILPGSAERPSQVKPIDWDHIERSTVQEAAPLQETALHEGRALRAATACSNAQKLFSKIGVEPVTGIVNETQNDKNVIATIRGRVVRYIVCSDTVTLGRSTFKSQMDVNLALEGPASKISRRQAIIERQPDDGNFYLKNVGRRPMHVDGKTISYGQKTMIRDGSVIEVSLIRLVFRIAHKRTIPMGPAGHCEPVELAGNQMITVWVEH